MPFALNEMFKLRSIAEKDCDNCSDTNCNDSTRGVKQKDRKDTTEAQEQPDSIASTHSSQVIDTQKPPEQVESSEQAAAVTTPLEVEADVSVPVSLLASQSKTTPNPPMFDIKEDSAKVQHRRPKTVGIVQPIDVDLTQPPAPLFRVNKEGDWINYADMHGNTLKLLYCMLQSGVILMSPADYHSFKRFYDEYNPAHQFTQKQKNELEAIFSTIHANPDSKAGVRLLGDIMADRGKNDYFTLKLLEKLDNLGINYEIILSNHDLVFMSAMEKFLNTDQTDKFIEHDLPLYVRSASQVTSSFINLYLLHNRGEGITTKQELSDLYHNYLKHLKALHVDKGLDNTPIIYSHAPMHPSHINLIATELGIQPPYIVRNNQITSVDYSRLEDVIINYNRTINKLAQQRRLADTKLVQEVDSIPTQIGMPAKYTSLYTHTWSREHDLESLLPIPSGRFLNIHGHNSGTPIDRFHIDLDTNLGKVVGHDRDKLNIFISSSVQPTASAAEHLGRFRAGDVVRAVSARSVPVYKSSRPPLAPRPVSASPSSRKPPLAPRPVSASPSSRKPPLAPRPASASPDSRKPPASKKSPLDSGQVRPQFRV